MGIDDVAVLPFAWPAVDAYHVLPTFAALRGHFTGSEEPGGADAVGDALTAAIDGAVRDAGHATLVLHTAMIELEREVVREVLTMVSAAVADGRLWSARCDEAADWILSHPAEFADPPAVDEISWMEPSTAERGST